MYLKSRVEAGVLLYSLLMASIFILIIQAYISQTNRLQAEHQTHLAMAKAYVMAEMTKACHFEKEKGQITYNTGTVAYLNKTNQLQLQISVEGGFDYSFNFNTGIQEKSENKPTIVDNYSQTKPSKKKKSPKEKTFNSPQ